MRSVYGLDEVRDASGVDELVREVFLLDKIALRLTCIGSRPRTLICFWREKRENLRFLSSRSLSLCAISLASRFGDLTSLTVTSPSARGPS